MAVLKSSALAGFLKQRDLQANAFLAYGADTGKVHETARALVQRIAGSFEDPFRVAHLKEDELNADPGRLADEFYAVAMLGGARAVWVSDAGQQFAAAVADLLGKRSGGNTIIAEAGNLKRKSALTAMFERADHAYAIPCYVDRTEDLSELIDLMIAQAGIGISREARGLLLTFLGDDRALTRSEIDKLLLYAHGRKEITAADVTSVCSGRAAPQLDDLCDAVLGGDWPTVDGLMQMLLEGGTAGSRLLAATAGHVAVLRRLSADIAAGTPPAIAVKSVFWPRQRKVAEQLQRWQDNTLSAAAATLAQAMLATRETPVLESQITGRALLAVARRVGRR